MNYDKLTKKELICTLIARDEMLKNCRERFELHKTTDVTTIQDQSDLIDVLNKALELACEECLSFPCSDYCSSNDDCEDCYYKREFTPENFKTKAKEMLKSE